MHSMNFLDKVTMTGQVIKVTVLLTALAGNYVVLGM